MVPGLGKLALTAPDVTPAGRCLDGLAEALYVRGPLALTSPRSACALVGQGARARSTRRR